MLSLQKRSGFKDDDIEDFIRKANEVEAAIKGMRDGTIKPEDVKVAGIESEEEKSLAEAERLKTVSALRARQEELRLKRKQEEKERWWAGSELFVKTKEESEKRCLTDDEIKLSHNLKLLNRYTADYSRWNEWIPSDPATVQEDKERSIKEDIDKNALFEKNNSEFCEQYIGDMKVREKAVKKKQDNSDSCRLKGNIFFKKKDYTSALVQYMDALKTLPYDPKTLLNIAQVNIKLKNYEDAEEFVVRSLTMDGNNIKALSRYACVLSDTGRAERALDQMIRALSISPYNADLIAQHRDVSAMVKEEQEERELKQLQSTYVSSVIRTDNNNSSSSSAGGREGQGIYIHSDQSAALPSSISISTSISTSLPQSIPSPPPSISDTTSSCTGHPLPPQPALSPSLPLPLPLSQPLSLPSSSREDKIALGLQRIDIFQTDLQQSLLTNCDERTDVHTDDNTELGKTSRIGVTYAGVDKISFADIRALLCDDEVEKCYRVHFRSNGALTALLNHAKERLEYLTQNSASAQQPNETKNTEVLDDTNNSTNLRILKVQEEVERSVDLISLCVNKDRAAKLKIVEAKIISTLKSYLTNIGKRMHNSNSSGDSHSDSRSQCKLLVSVMRLLCVCCEDDCEQLRSVLRKDRSILPTLCGVIGDIAFQRTEEGVNQCVTVSQRCTLYVGDGQDVQNVRTYVLYLITELSVLVRSLASGVTAIMGREGGGVVLTLATAVNHFALPQSHPFPKPDFHLVPHDARALSAMVESCVQALVHLSQIPSVRSFFALPLSLSPSLSLSPPSPLSLEPVTRSDTPTTTTTTADSEDTVTAVHVLLNLAQLRPENTANCLGVLMNACLENTLSTPPPAPLFPPLPSSCTTADKSTLPPTVTPIISSSSSANTNTHPPSTSTTVTVRETVALSGGVEFGLKGVRMGSKERVAFYETDRAEGFSFLSRCAGLLSRLIDLKPIQDIVSTPNTYRQLCRTLASTILMIKTTSERLEILVLQLERNAVETTLNNDGQYEAALDTSLLKKERLDEKLKFLREELSSLVRTLASLSKLSEDCLVIAKEEKLVHTLLFIFPTPRDELGEITPKSVILVPKNPAPVILLGNSARCLLALADDSGRNAALLFDIRGTSSLFCESHSGDVHPPLEYENDKTPNSGKKSLQPSIPVCAIERLICAMATCSDIRVRRNISILLAKGCRISGVRNHVELFRGMQIMLELQKQL